MSCNSETTIDYVGIMTFMIVDIIIPIYNAFDDLQICLQSIYKNTDLKKNRLILINDNSPDERIKPFLDEQVVGHSNIIAIHNEVNKGFSANINLGIAQSQKNDVILLNSDTIVTADWVEKMVKCAYSDPAIGTVTPLSNNATLCSVPNFCEENVLPVGMSIEEAAAIVDHCSFRSYPDITVAHGFCMMIKREVIDSIGNFDAETFGKGYGEENDFCNRAEQAGYKHVMCDDTYIYHSGTKSFLSKEKEEYIQQHEKILYQRYPRQMHNNDVHCRDNPNKKIGENVGIYFGLHNHKKNVLYLVQSDFRNGAADNLGGTQLHVHDLVYALKEKYNIFVVARDGEKLVLTVYIDNKNISFAFPMPQERLYPILTDKKIKEFWSNVLNAFKIDLIHIHHLYGTSFDICDVAHEKNIPFVFTLHDFFFICPSIKMLDINEQVCIGKESKEKCMKCLCAQMGYAPTLDYISLWRKRCEKYLRWAEKIIVPSESTKEVFIKYYPFIEEQTIVIEHGYWLQTNNITGTLEGKESERIVTFFEHCNKQGGLYCAEGWAYVEDTDCRENEIWLKIRNSSGEKCDIPTTVQYRPDVSTDENKTRCGYRGYIPSWICIGDQIDIQVYIKTPQGIFKERDHHIVKIKAIKKRNSLNIAFIGGLNVAKGGKKVAAIIKKGPVNVNWYIFGGIGVEDLQNLERDNLVKTGFYKPQHLSILLREHRIDLICILSLWPETYSYTLTEAILNRIPVITTNVGALGARTVKGEYGWTVELDNIEKETILQIEKLLENREILQEKKEFLTRVTIKDCQMMAQEYSALYEKYFNYKNKILNFDADYIYTAYLRANGQKDFNDTIGIEQRKRLEEANAELKILKSSLTYRIMMRIVKMRIPFKQKIKALLMKNR